MYNLVKAMKALSDDTRLRIIGIILERECCVCEVIQALDISQTRASRNLTILYDAGFLKLRKVGLWSLYSLDKDGIPDYMSGLVEAVRLALVDNSVAKRDRERLKAAIRSGTGCVTGDNGTCARKSIVQENIPITSLQVSGIKPG
ncbi:MAG: winged helix-turn-helix transcriptional regulator [Dehalococcoidales bacterium]|nr:winged helix-turn-helix transcriptional regulator [Dehalococcoidales bacterium]